jgi:hypothetical protein
VPFWCFLVLVWLAVSAIEGRRSEERSQFFVEGDVLRIWVVGRRDPLRTRIFDGAACRRLGGFAPQKMRPSFLSCYLPQCRKCGDCAGGMAGRQCEKERLHAFKHTSH